MQVIDTHLPKLCHAAIGDTVQLMDEAGAPIADYFLVCANPNGKRGARPLMSHGLYDDQRPLFLVSLSTGEARPMPNLSSRVDIIKNARVVIGDEPKPAGEEPKAPAYSLIGYVSNDTPANITKSARGATLYREQTDRHSVAVYIKEA